MWNASASFPAPQAQNRAVFRGPSSLHVSQGFRDPSGQEELPCPSPPSSALGFRLQPPEIPEEEGSWLPLQETAPEFLVPQP